MKKILLLLSFSIALILPLQAISAVDMFLKIEGINGESTDAEHQGEIDVLGMTWGVTSSATINRGGRHSNRGKPSKGSITITKLTDQTSTFLMDNCCNGRVYRDAILVVRQTETRAEYIRLEMKNLVITSISTNGPSDSDERLTESFTLNYEAVKTEYTPQNRDGSSGSKVETSWKVERGE